VKVVVSVVVDLKVCDGDGVCADVCPMNVFDIEEVAEYGGDRKSIPSRMEDCILCMACVSACPQGAITVEE